MAETDNLKIMKASKQQAAYNIKPSLASTKKLANELTQFIKDNRLSSNIAGKDYVQVEGWEFAGSQLNLTAIVEDIEDLSKDKEIKYKASVKIVHVLTDKIVSRGFAIASSNEKGRNGSTKWKDEYAVASMAQTRAIGKGYRNILSWLIKLAGYEPTPAEEVDRDKMDDDLAKAKRDVIKAFNEAGITHSSEMIAKIESAIGKAVIETVDDAFTVISDIQAIREES